jgi:hypothetical protein
VSALALGGRNPGSDTHVSLTFPLEDGRFYVANGGTVGLINAHVGWAADPRLAAYRGQQFGVDLIQVDPLGFRTRKGVLGRPFPSNPEEYLIFGQPILAPCDGRIEAARDGLPDLPIPETDRANPTGNHVLLRCGDITVLLAHMRRGSVTAAVGAEVKTGNVVGQVGNSGNTGEPHLHIHAQQPGASDAPLAANGVVIRFDGALLTRNTSPGN